MQSMYNTKDSVTIGNCNYRYVIISLCFAVFLTSELQAAKIFFKNNPDKIVSTEKVTTFWHLFIVFSITE